MDKKSLLNVILTLNFLVSIEILLRNDTFYSIYNHYSFWLPYCKWEV